MLARLLAWLSSLWEAPRSAPAPSGPQQSADAARGGLIDLGKLTPAERRATILRDAVEPALAFLDKRGVASDRRARVLLLAIAGQESDAQHRRQIPIAYAKGLWQFERGGGVAGVLSHKATSAHAAALLEWRGVSAIATDAWDALANDDVLAAGFARLLLWSDPQSLPADSDGGWAVYLRCWRPGKPHPTRWPGNWQLADAAAPQ